MWILDFTKLNKLLKMHVFNTPSRSYRTMEIRYGLTKSTWTRIKQARNITTGNLLNAISIISKYSGQRPAEIFNQIITFEKEKI